MNTQLTAQQGNIKKVKLPSESWKIRSSSGLERSKTNSFKGQIPEMLLKIAELSTKVTFGQLPSTNVNDLSPEGNDPSPKIEEESKPDAELNDEFSPEHNKLPPKIEEVTSQTAELFPEKRRKDSPEILVSSPPDVDEGHKETRVSQTLISPSFSRCSFLSKYGGKLTEAGKNLSDQEMYLLYEDIFKPIDVNAMRANAVFNQLFNI